MIKKIELSTCYCGECPFGYCKSGYSNHLSRIDKINASCKDCGYYPMLIDNKWRLYHDKNCNDPSRFDDPRKIGLKMGLRQLTVEQLKTVIDYEKDMCLDSYNYENEKFCPLAVALQLDKKIKNPTHQIVYDTLISMGYLIYNTRGIKGTFYREDRLADLLIAAKEVLSEKLF